MIDPDAQPGDLLSLASLVLSCQPLLLGLHSGLFGVSLGLESSALLLRKPHLLLLLGLPVGRWQPLVLVRSTDVPLRARDTSPGSQILGTGGSRVRIPQKSNTAFMEDIIAARAHLNIATFW